MDDSSQSYVIVTRQVAHGCDGWRDELGWCSVKRAEKIEQGSEASVGHELRTVVKYVSFLLLLLFILSCLFIGEFRFVIYLY